MKKFFIQQTMLLVLAMLMAATSHAQFIVKIRPSAPVIVRPIAPSQSHVWVDGEWMWRGGHYEYVNGYWATPRYAGAVWIPGHWKNSRRGWIWKPGHWRR